MAVKAGTAYIDVEGDFSGLNKQVSSHFGKITRQAEGTGKKIGRSLGVGMAAGVAATAVAGKQLFDFGKEAVDVASDVNESLSKNQVLFGKYAKGIESFSKRSADSLGISRKAALEYTGTFGNLFTALGVSNKQSAEFSTNLVKLSADMASFNNTSIEDALEAIRSGLVGETEPLRKFGVNINDSALKAEALASGLVKVHVDQGKMRASTLALELAQDKLAKAVKEHGANSTEAKQAQLGLENAQNRVNKVAGGQTITLTAQDKALAAMSLTTKLTSKAHGDFQRTSDQLANSQRRLQARWEDVKTTLGSALLPAVNRVTTELLHMADRVQPKVEGAVKGISKAFASKDLTLGEKIQRSWDAVKLSFGPLVDNLVDGIKDAHLDQKLKDAILWAEPKILEGVKHVGLKSAETWWEAFKAAPLWAKVGGGVWLANKLGIAGPAGKKLFSWLTGGGGGLISKATPMPVYVTNLGGLPGGVPGGGGAPVPTGPLGKLKGVAKGAGKFAGKIAALDFAIRLVDSKGEPLAAAINTAHDLTFGIVPSVDPQGAAKRNLSAFQQDLQRLSNSGDIKGLEKKLQDMLSFSTFDAKGGIKKAIGDINRTIEQVKLQKLGINVTIDTDKALGGAKLVREALERMRSGSSKSVRDLRTDVRFNMRLIKRNFADDSAAAKEAISANFTAAIGNIKTSMKEGTISVRDGTKLIQEYMVRSLMNFGFSHEQALNVARDPTRRTSVTGGPEEGTRGPGHQRGGFINLGAMSGDSVPAMLERHEYVLNRKAVRKIGKSTLDRLNFGEAPRFQRGGSVTGDTDFLPALMHALRALSGSVGVPIFVQSGRRTRAEQLALGPSTPQHPVAGPNGPHVRGIAADITPGYEVFGRAASRFGLGFTVMPQEPWHIQLTDAAAAAGAKAVSFVAEKIAGVKVLGPGSALKTIAQSAIDITQGAAQGVVNQAAESLAAQPGGEAAIPPHAGALSKAQLKRLWIRAGGNPGLANTMAAIALAESGGIPTRNNADRPGDGGRHIAAGLWQILGLPFAGNVYDPLTNARMAVAKYESQGLGAWEAYTSGSYRQYLQRGGLVGGLIATLLQNGGVPTGAFNAKLAKVAKPKPGHKPANDRVKRTIARVLGKIGFTAEKDNLDRLAKQVAIDDEYAQRLSGIVDTDAIQEALNAELTKRGGTSDMSDAQIAQIFPTSVQDQLILSMLPRIGGGTQLDWLNKELEDLLGQRNVLIDEPPILSQMRKQVAAQITQLTSDINDHVHLIKAYSDRRGKIIELRKDKHEDLADTLKERNSLAGKHKKTKADRERLGRLDNTIDRLRTQIDVLNTGDLSKLEGHPTWQTQLDNQLNFNQYHLPGKPKSGPFPGLRDHFTQGRAWYVDKLRQENADNTARTNARDQLKDSSDDGVASLPNIDSALDGIKESLETIQGIGSPMTKYTSSAELWAPNGNPNGVLGGTILGVQQSISELVSKPPRAQATESGAATGSSEAEQRTKEILEQLLREANLRFAVSQAQYDVFREFPFGGFFKEGGMVPGPYGAPRMILAHGGEVVIPNDANYTPHVSLHFANGMEWLKQFVDVRVDTQTRAQSRRSERQLPGLPGALR